MANIKLIIDCRRSKKDGSYPLVFRITQGRDTRDISTGFSIHKEHWNEKVGGIIETEPLYKIIYSRIQELHLTYLSKLLEFERLFPLSTNVQDLKEYLLQKPKQKVLVSEFWENEIKQLEKAYRMGSANVYSQTLIALKKMRNLNISFEQVDYKFLKDVEAELLNKGIGINTIAIYYRTLRAVYNKAINLKEVSYEHYPFRKFRIHKEITRPRVLTLQEMQNYFNADIDKNSWLYESWLMGKLMFMLIGINFKDMVLMSETQIKHGRLIYNRAKTGRQYSIKLIPEALEILDYFRGRSDKTILGKINPKQLANRIRLPLDITQANKVYNKHIGLIGKDLEIKEQLTGYCFRYTWANLAKQMNYSKDLISEALGHSYGLRVTGIYLEAYDLEHIDKMNQAICDEVKKKAQK